MALRLKTHQIAVFENRPPVGIHRASEALCISTCMFLNVPSPHWQLQFWIPDHRLFKSKTAPDESSSDFFTPSIILAFLSTICHYSLLHLVICVLWSDTCTQREPICVGGVSGQRRWLISDQWICRRPENLAGSNLMLVCLLVCIISHSILGMSYLSWED